MNKKKQDLVDLHLFQLGVNDLFSPSTPLHMDVLFLFFYFYKWKFTSLLVICRSICSWLPSKITLQNRGGKGFFRHSRGKQGDK